MPTTLSLVKSASVVGAAIAGVSKVMAINLVGGGILLAVISDPVIILEALALLYLAYFIAKDLFPRFASESRLLRWDPERWEESRNIFPVLTMVGVGALISEPKRSLKRQ